MRGNPVVIKNFDGHYGVGTTDAYRDGQIPENGFRTLKNIMVTSKGTLRPRRGIRRETGTLNLQNATLLGQWRTAAGINKAVITSNSGVTFCDSNGTNANTPTATAADLLLQQNNKAFLFRDATTNIRTWDNTTLTTTTIAVNANVGVVHKSRMFVANNASSGTTRSQIRYSEIFDLNAPDTTAGWPALNTIDIQSTDADFITAMIVMNDVLFVFKRFSTWAVYVEGEPSWTVRNLHPTIGCIGRDTVQAIGGLIYFRSSTGVYRTDGTTFELISGPVKEWFDDQPGMLYSDCNKRSGAWWGEYYILSDNYSTRWHVYNIDNGAWSTFDTAANPISRIYYWPEYSPPRLVAMEYITGSATGTILKFEELNGFGDGSGSTTVACELATKAFDFDKPSEWKMLREVALETTQNLGAGSLTMNGTVWSANVSVATAAVASPNEQGIFRFRGPFRCKDAQLEIDFNSTVDLEITAFVFDVGVVGQIGKNV